MQRVDIRPLKQKLRAEIKEWRRAMPDGQKKRADRKIRERLVRLREYARCHTLLAYVSLPIEVDTLGLIERALADGKRVAVPRCIEGSHEMEFYYITGMEDLAPQTCGVLEPVPGRCELVTRYDGSICIVPALAYDRSGFRLGYGAGYYDRFLSRYPHPKIGIPYAHNLCKGLWHGRYDVAVDLVVTESRLCVCAAQPQRTKSKRSR